jgi:hypothetical protein
MLPIDCQVCWPTAQQFHTSVTILYNIKRCQSLLCLHILLRGIRWRGWFRHCATTRKVVGSVPDGITGILIEIILPAALWPWADSAFNRNEYQE